MPASRPRLLLADDHEEFLEEVSRLLADDFELVGWPATARNWWSEPTNLSPDAVVTDFKMPKLTGIVAGAQMMESWACLAVVLLTIIAIRNWSVTR